jgi:hypothetical protein
LSIKPDGMTLVKELKLPCQKLPDYPLDNFGNLIFTGVQMGLIPNKGVEIVKVQHPSAKDRMIFMFVHEDRNEATFIVFDKKNYIMTWIDSGSSPQMFRWMCQKHLEWSNYMDEKETEQVLAQQSRQAKREYKKRMQQYAKQEASYRG